MHVYRLPKLFTQDHWDRELIFEGDWIVHENRNHSCASPKRGHTTCSATPTTTPTHTRLVRRARGIAQGAKKDPQSYAAARQ